MHHRRRRRQDDATQPDLVHSRYAGNAQFDQAWVDAPSPITVDDVRFSSDNVPGDWATMDAFLGNFGPPTPEDMASSTAYYYAFTSHTVTSRRQRPTSKWRST